MGYTVEGLAKKYESDIRITVPVCEMLLKNSYVRSQVQLTLAGFGGIGHVLNFDEALDIFGIDTLLEVINEGYVALVHDANEPSSTIRSRRESLNISKKKLAICSGLELHDIEKVETAGTVTPIREIEKIAQKLALDDRKISFVPGACGDSCLSVRLRELAGRDTARFTENVVLDLAEAAWVVARQISLSESLGFKQHRLLSIEKDRNYNFPTWRIGYELAEKTRFKLGYYHDEPIESLRSLVEDTLCIPLIQLRLDERFAGATICNGSYRGIVVNECGKNSNVCVRRMTISHELAHLLWDPDEQLNKLAVDEYDDLEDFSYNVRHDAPEIRANAFAVAFLAPVKAIEKIASKTKNINEVINEVVKVFRISATAARNHVQNILDVKDKSNFDNSILVPLKEWEASENLAIDFFPFAETPISRRGRFARLVVKAWVDKIVSSDSAALMLWCSREEFEEKARMILDLQPIDSVAREEK